MITLSFRLKEAGVNARAVGGQRRFNEIMRAALTKAAEHWVRKLLPMHFSPTAGVRYSYAPRSRRYEAKKQRFQREGLVPISGGGFSGVTRGAFENLPLVWTGNMREQVLSQRYHPQATATRGRQTVRVPIPLGHPVGLRTSDEVSRLLPDELQEMHDVAAEHLFAELQRVGVTNVQL